MTHCIEPLVRDLVWCWLDENEKYERISGEVTIGSGINEGRIDIVAKTTNDQYHGYEIKDTGLSPEQLNRYVKSGYLDKVYHCSRVGSDIESTLEDISTVKGVHRFLLDLRSELSNGIAAGQYSESEVINAVRQTVGEQTWNEKLHGFGKVNSRLLDEEEKTVKSFFTSNLGIPSADFDPNKTYIGLDTAVRQIENEIALPNEVGVLHIPLPLDDEHFDEEGNYNPNEEWRATLQKPVSEVFTPSNVTDVKVLQDATPLTRKSRPSLSRTNESWVQHHVWRTFGTIREAVVPCSEENSIRRVDIMRFEGADTATEVYQNSADAEIIGVEAKGEVAVGGESSNIQVREQLRSYLKSGCLTRLYLAVPATARSKAQNVLDVERTAPLSNVGLITVDKKGELTFVEEAQQRSQLFDGYVKADGRSEYTRSVGYGRVEPTEEMAPESLCQIQSD